MVPFFKYLLRKSDKKEKKNFTPFPAADWWNDDDFAKEIAELRGNFVDFNRNMDKLEEKLRKVISFPEGCLCGPIDYLSVQGTEGPVWCLLPSRFGRMPTPIRSDLRVAVFEPEGDSFLMNLVRLCNLQKDEFAKYATGAIFFAPESALR